MLREGDALPYLRLKQELTESSHQALFESGDVLPVWIRGHGTGKIEMFVEIETPPFLVDPRKLAAFIRLEVTPEEKAWQEEHNREAARQTEAKPKDFQELQQRAEQSARNSMAERYAQNKSQHSEFGTLGSKWAGFADAAQRERNVTFRGK